MRLTNSVGLSGAEFHAQRWIGAQPQSRTSRIADRKDQNYYSNKIRLLALPWPFKEDLLNAIENARQGP